jgi:hypothetical protein
MGSALAEKANSDQVNSDPYPPASGGVYVGIFIDIGTAHQLKVLETSTPSQLEFMPGSGGVPS